MALRAGSRDSASVRCGTSRGPKVGTEGGEEGGIAFRGIWCGECGEGTEDDVRVGAV